jgi:7TM diverse intracellular signalling
LWLAGVAFAYARPLHPAPSTPAGARFLLPGLTTAAVLWFSRTVTEPARFSQALDVAVWAMIAATLGAVATDTLVQTRSSFLVLMALTMGGLVLGMVLIGLVWAEGEDSYIRLIALGFLPVVLMALFPVARGLNLIPASMLTRYGVSIGAAIEMPILFYARSLRGSRRREAEVRAAALSRTDALTGLAHQRSLLHRLEASLARCIRQKHGCALLARKLANWDAIATSCCCSKGRPPRTRQPNARSRGSRAGCIAPSTSRRPSRCASTWPWRCCRTSSSTARAASSGCGTRSMRCGPKHAARSAP